MIGRGSCVRMLATSVLLSGFISALPSSSSDLHLDTSFVECVSAETGAASDAWLTLPDRETCANRCSGSGDLMPSSHFLLYPSTTEREVRCLCLSIPPETVTSAISTARRYPGGACREDQYQLHRTTSTVDTPQANSSEPEQEDATSEPQTGTGKQRLVQEDIEMEVLDLVSQHGSQAVLAADLRTSRMRCEPGLTACKVSPDVIDGYICADITADLWSCGGCIYGEFANDSSRLGASSLGTDCQAIRGPALGAVRCTTGRCVADECEEGYTLMQGECQRVG